MLWALTLALLVTVSLAPAAGAAEYRLQVGSLYEGSFAHFLNGGIGRGEGELVMERLDRSLDEGAVGRGAILYDRPVQPAGEAALRAFGAVRVEAVVKPSDPPRLQDEVTWQGKPGERSLWIIGGSRMNDQEVIHLALKGRGPLRYHIPYTVARSTPPLAAISYPLHFLWFHEGRGSLWERYLRRALDLRDGVAVVVGVNANPTFTDWVYIVVEHPAEPAIFKVVVGWDRRRSADRSNLEGDGSLRD
jgi:hypothetical protein